MLINENHSSRLKNGATDDESSREYILKLKKFTVLITSSQFQFVQKLVQGFN